MQGQSALARPLFQKTYDIRLKQFGIKNEQTLVSAADLASVYQATGDCERAIELRQTVVKQREAILGADHPQNDT